MCYGLHVRIGLGGSRLMLITHWVNGDGSTFPPRRSAATLLMAGAAWMGVLNPAAGAISNGSSELAGASVGVAGASTTSVVNKGRVYAAACSGGSGVPSSSGSKATMLQ